MQIGGEGKIGIIIGLLGLFGAGAIMIAPQQLWIGWGLIAIAVIGSALLAGHHFAETTPKPRGAKRTRARPTAISVRRQNLPFVLFSLLVPLSAVVLLIVFRETPSNISHAVLRFSGLSRIQPPGMQPLVNAYIGNTGNSIATNVGILLNSRLSEQQLQESATQFELNRLETAVSELAGADPSHSQIAPREQAIITLQELKPEESWSDIVQKRRTRPEIIVNDEQWNAIAAGRLWLYIFGIAHYEDEVTESKAYWKWAFCGYFVLTTDIVHRCAANDIVRINKSRF